MRRIVKNECGADRAQGATAPNAPIRQGVYRGWRAHRERQAEPDAAKQGALI